MKLYKKCWILSVLAISGYAPSAVGLDIILESMPINYGYSTSPNLLLTIDDSGSMDSEISLFNTDGGYGHWRNNTLVAGGQPQTRGGRWYSHLFPLGDTNTTGSTSTDIYNGGRLWSAQFLPPFDAYGFFRSSDWNGAYYDPEVTYNPWPSYGGHSWPDIDSEKAWLDPGLVGTTSNRYLDLTTTTLATQFSGDYSEFDFYENMWCDNSGTLCNSDQDQDLDYWAATYYVTDTSSTFDTSSHFGASLTQVDPSNAIIIEAESGDLSNVTLDYDVDAGQGAYVNYEGYSNGADRFLNSPPATHEGAWTFDTTSTEAEIWVRHRMDDIYHDSFWMALEDHGSTQISPSDDHSDNIWITDHGHNWFKWWTGLDSSTYSPVFKWEKWADVDLDGSGSYTLRIRQREDDVGLDQIAIVTGTSPSFSTVEALTNDTVPAASDETYSCGDASHIKPQNYTRYHDDPSSISGVDAFAPDGSCLEKVEIKSSRSNYPSNRNYSEEIQNFANWFTYHRKRHQTARDALGASLQGVSNVRAGLFWINDRRSIEMYDLDKPAELETLLDENYYYVSNGGTPTRTALEHAGQQFDTDTDIIEYACQKNYTLLFTDGYASDNSFSSVGNADSGAGTPYEDNVSNTVADVAYKYYNKVLRSGDFTRGEVPVDEACEDETAEPWVDCGDDLHMNTYAVSMGLTGRDVFEQSFIVDGVTRYYNKVKDAHDGNPSWPDPLNGNDGSMMDDLYHATVNGRGEMFNADSSDKLSQEVQAAVKNILKTVGSASGLAFNTATLSTESLIFTASFNTTDWSGELKAIKLDPETGYPDGTAWSVKDKLDAQSSRNIITYDPLNETGIPFQWNNLTAGQKADLSVAPNGTADTNGEARVDFIRGDTSKDGIQFRERSALLGDIVNSSPVFIGPAVMAWPEYEAGGNEFFGTSTHPYSRFKVEVGEVRDPIIYVAANDGMVHGFLADRSATAGEEVLGYIPSTMYSADIKRGMHYLTDPDYTHRFYTDGEPIYSDVFVKPKGEVTAEWMTILAGGYQGGAKGLYALDVTDPSRFAEANASERVLFEITGDMDADLGYLHEPPLIGMMNNGEWAMIFGNGFNSTNSGTANDEGVIYIAMIEDIIHNGVQVGTNLIKRTTGTPGAVSGISGADTNGDKVIDYVYATDAAGYIWSLDMTGSTKSKWDFAYSKGNTPLPLFTAENDSSQAQPILVKTRAIKNVFVESANTNAPNRLIVFGTGQMLEGSDLSNTDVQSFYAVWDDGTGNLTRANLAESTLTQAADGSRTLANGASLYEGTNKGFYVDFDTVSGERVIDYVDIRKHHKKTASGESLYYGLFSSVVPESDPCSYGGRSWFNAFDLKTGETPERLVFDSNNDGAFVEDDGDPATTDDDKPLASLASDDFLVDFVSAGFKGYGNTSDNEITVILLEKNGTGGGDCEGCLNDGDRQGWQELINR